MSSVSPGAACTIVVASANVDTGCPSTDTMTSPGLIPASAAGEAGSSGVHSVAVEPAGTTHSVTEAIVVVPCCRPIPDSSTVKITVASTRFMAGPPSITITRFHTGRR